MALRSFAGGALFAEVLGEGRPRVLALHGWGRRGADFRAGLAGLPTLAPDLPGFGASPLPNGVIGAHGYASIVAQILEEFDRPPVLVGHSFGGRVALCLAASHSVQVGSLILTGTPVLRLRPAQRPAAGYRMARALNRFGLISDERLEREKRKRGSADYRRASGTMRDILVKVVNESYESELASVPNPIVFLWGEADAEVPVEVAERALRIRTDAGLPGTLRVAEGVGHHLPIEAPHLLAETVGALTT